MKSFVVDSELTQERSLIFINSQNNRKDNPSFYSFIRTQFFSKNNSKSLQLTLEEH